MLFLLSQFVTPELLGRPVLVHNGEKFCLDHIRFPCNAVRGQPLLDEGLLPAGERSPGLFSLHRVIGSIVHDYNGAIR